MTPHNAALLDAAIQLAVKAHAGQTQRNGQPYVLHPLHLMAQMDSAEAMMVAVLHDVVEDTAVTLDDLRALGLPPVVLETVALLTHPPEMPYMAYIERLKAHPLARQVKLADLAHNMDVRRLPSMGEKDFARCARYFEAWQRLQV